MLTWQYLFPWFIFGHMLTNIYLFRILISHLTVEKIQLNVFSGYSCVPLQNHVHSNNYHVLPCPTNALFTACLTSVPQTVHFESENLKSRVTVNKRGVNVIFSVYFWKSFFSLLSFYSLSLYSISQFFTYIFSRTPCLHTLFLLIFSHKSEWHLRISSTMVTSLSPTTMLPFLTRTKLHQLLTPIPPWQLPYQLLATLIAFK